MPGQRTPAAAGRLGGVTSRRHAELLLHSGVGVSVKDLRLRRVVPPASGSLDSSPECPAPVKPGSAESTPPEAASAAAAAAEDLDRKPVLPRSKLVRDPGSFGYRRLLPFLNEMAKNDSSDGNGVTSENTSVHSKNELSRSHFCSVDESLGRSHRESDAMDSIEPFVVRTGGGSEVKDGCNNVAEETNTVPQDLASSKPCLARCTRSRFVHHPSSFSSKRMLPFLMENEISSQESDRVKIRRVAEERQPPSDETDVSASGQQHLAVSDDSSQECNTSQVERMEEEKQPEADENHVLDDRQLQPAVPEASPPEFSAVEVQNDTHQEDLTSSQDPLTSCEGELTSENTAAHSKNELSRSHFGAVDESFGRRHRESDAMDSVEPLVVNTEGGPEVKNGCNSVTEETNTVPHDLPSSKPCLARCNWSRFVHHLSSFSYKRMLPFLVENASSSQENDRVKIRRVAEERPSDKIDVSASGQQHLSVSDDSSQECNTSQVERMEGEKQPKADENHVLDDRQLQPAVPEASPPEFSAVEVQNVTHQEDLTSSQDPLTCEGESTSDGNDAPSGGQCQLAVSVDSPDECNRDEVTRSVQEKAVKSDGGYVLDSREVQPDVSEDSSEACDRDEVNRSVQDKTVKSDGLDNKEFHPDVSGVSPMENCIAEVQKAAQEGPLPLARDEETSEKVNHLAQEQHRPCVTNESLTAELQDNAECTEVSQSQNLGSGCHDVDFGSPTRTAIPLLNQNCAEEHEDNAGSSDDPPLGTGITFGPSDPCVVLASLSVEEMSGCVPLTEPGPNKTGILRSGGAHSMEKRGLSPKKLSPKKGILKRHTRGCKGICMCLDCCTFRLRADRAFEFSRKQMREADDIITNLLEEVASLKSLMEKPASQREKQIAWRRASRVEEVARDRTQQMFLDLNAHCRIPGPRVRFAQYVDEQKGSPSPRISKRR